MMGLIIRRRRTRRYEGVCSVCGDTVSYRVRYTNAIPPEVFSARCSCRRTVQLIRQ